MQSTYYWTIIAARDDIIALTAKGPAGLGWWDKHGFFKEVDKMGKVFEFNMNEDSQMKLVGLYLHAALNLKERGFSDEDVYESLAQIFNRDIEHLDVYEEKIDSLIDCVFQLADTQDAEGFLKILGSRRH